MKHRTKKNIIIKKNIQIVIVYTLYKIILLFVLRKNQQQMQQKHKIKHHTKLVNFFCTKRFIIMTKEFIQWVVKVSGHRISYRSELELN